MWIFFFIFENILFFGVKSYDRLMILIKALPVCVVVLIVRVWAESAILKVLRAIVV